ncbi:MAG: serine/threonine protein kinase [Deltaproteobacteria bacterium]|nr:serine/threonine protein kinase [Deltaproteobacteria bacterium]
MAPSPSTSRYDTILKLASGGMATVWVGTVRGALGFRQLVAIKKPHPHMIATASFRAELLAEARLASMIHHANVVDVRDVEIEGESISLVMDYIEGASLGEMIVAATRAGKRMAPRVIVRIVLDALAGLHAAHELVDERDRPVGLVHRDISPQNILVGSDGIARVADFGVAKFARKNMESTSNGSLKGKLAYMAPEYLKGESIDRRFDLFAMGIVLWEAIAGRRCFRGDNEAETLNKLLTFEPEPISTIVPEAAPIEAVLACALAKARDDRFANAAAMAAALEASAGSAGLLGGHSEVAAAVKEVAGKAIEERRALVRAKLANEPSVASLMGAVVDPRLVAAPAEGEPPTEAAPPPREEAPSTAAAPATAVPATTLPFTPRMEGAPDLPPDVAQARGARTLASPVAAPAAAGAAPVPTTLPLAGASGPPPPVNATHLSAGVVMPPMSPPVAPAVAQAAPAATEPVDEPQLPPPRRWVLPLIVGVVTASIATGAIVFATRQTGPAGAAPGSSTAPAATSLQSTPIAPSASVASATAVTATASAAASTSPSTTTSPLAPIGKPPKGKAGKPAGTGAGAAPPGAAPPEPLPPAEPTRKAPPPNPYQE